MKTTLKKQKLVVILTLSLFGMGHANAAMIFGNDGTNTTFKIPATNISHTMSRFVFEDAYSVEPDINTQDTLIMNNDATPMPAAVWLFASGLLGLVGVARRNNT